MASRKDRKRKKSGSPPKDPNPMKPVSLTPMQLRNDQARPISSQPFQARETRMVSYSDNASPAKQVHENRYEFASVQELRPALKQEQSLTFELRPITVSPIQMQLLRERRVAARDLGWVIPGHRIRIGE